jgi:hypothetical protein
MKRIFVILVASGLLLVGVGSVCAQTILAEDDFEDGDTSDWGRFSTATIVAVLQGENYVGRMSNSIDSCGYEGSGKFAPVYKEFPAQTGVFAIEFRGMSDGPGGAYNHRAFTFNDVPPSMMPGRCHVNEAYYAIGGVSYQGNYEFHTWEHWFDGTNLNLSFTPNQWDSFKFVIDVPNNEYMVFINETTHGPFPFARSVSSISYFQISSEYKNVYIDDLKIYDLPTKIVWEADPNIHNFNDSVGGMWEPDPHSLPKGVQSFWFDVSKGYPSIYIQSNKGFCDSDSENPQCSRVKIRSKRNDFQYGKFTAMVWIPDYRELALSISRNWFGLRRAIAFFLYQDNGQEVDFEIGYGKRADRMEVARRIQRGLGEDELLAYLTIHEPGDPAIEKTTKVPISSGTWHALTIKVEPSNSGYALITWLIDGIPIEVPFLKGQANWLDLPSFRIECSVENLHWIGERIPESEGGTQFYWVSYEELE